MAGRIPKYFIAALLLFTATVQATSYAPKSRFFYVKHSLLAIESTLEHFKKDIGRYPTTEEGLKVLVAPTPELLKMAKYPKEGYLPRLPRDAWNSEYQYLFPGKQNAGGFDLWSLGADGKPGGLGFDSDLGNWPGGMDAYENAMTEINLKDMPIPRILGLILVIGSLCSFVASLFASPRYSRKLFYLSLLLFAIASLVAGASVRV
jgi:general secretion pathway protein G